MASFKAVIVRLIASFALGCAFYAVLVFTVIRFNLPIAISRILLWNVSVFGFIGSGGQVGYMPDGKPIYDGSIGYLGFSVESILTGFVIYPAIIFAGHTIYKEIQQSNN